MHEFHVTVHPRGAEDRPGPVRQLHGATVSTLLVDAAVGSRHFAVAFEQVCAALEELDRMFVEPDGSLVWSGAHDNARWQLEGMLYDEGGKLLYAELWGRCPPAQFDQLLHVFGWPKIECIFFLVREGVWLDLASFRCYACPTAVPPGND